MSKSQLARKLGISRTMLYRLINRGMPTGSVEAARKWRQYHLDTMQTKEWRIDGNTGLKRKRIDASYTELVERVNASYHELTERLTTLK